MKHATTAVRRVLPVAMLAGALVLGGSGGARAQTIGCEREIEASESLDALDEFGKAVSVHGDVLAVGTPRRDGVFEDEGAVYVYRFDGADWLQETKLLGSGSALRSRFGKDVAVWGDTLAVGAAGQDAQRGVVYVFRHDGTSWVEEAVIRPDDPFAHEDFGVSIAMGEDVMVVGADREATGAAFVFRRGAGGWTQEQKLTPSDPTPDQRFGLSVDLDGDTIVVGAYRIGHGSAWVFRHDGTGWSEEQRLDPPDGADFDRFGWSVAVDGDVVAVGAVADDDHATNSGSVHLFRHDGTGWAHETKLLPSHGNIGGSFGNDVSVLGDDLAVGAFGDNVEGRESGAVYLFEREAAGWEESLQLRAPTERSFDRFGEALELDGQSLVVGMPGAQGGELRPTGAAWAWRFSPDGNHPPVADAGGDVGVECSGPNEGTVLLDGSASFDPDSTREHDDIVAYQWFEDFGGANETLLGTGSTLELTLSAGTRIVTLRVTDDFCASGTDAITVRVDTVPPEGAITAPEPNTCFGPDEVPVVVEDDFTDDCDDELERTYSPFGGPSYSEHRSRTVTVRARDEAGNEGVDSVFFTIDLVRPVVTLTAPDAMVVGTEMPFSDFFFVNDFDSAAGGAVLEQVFWDECLVYDGLTYGDADGILTDDTLVFGMGELCEAMARCGIEELDDSLVRVEATDCGGNPGAAEKTIQTDPVVFLRDCGVEMGAASHDEVTWTPLFEAEGYDLIRGDLDRLADAGEHVDLGPVTCLADDAGATSFADPAIPEPGRAFFYLVRYRYGPTLTEYGWSSAVRPERPSTGGCTP